MCVYYANTLGHTCCKKVQLSLNMLPDSNACILVIHHLKYQAYLKRHHVFNNYTL